MEPLHRDAGAPSGSEGSPPALLALLAPDVVVDSLTGSTLPLPPGAEAQAAGVPPPDAPATVAASALASPAPEVNASPALEVNASPALEVSASAAWSAAAPVPAAAEASTSIPGPALAAEALAPVPFRPWQGSSPSDGAPSVLTIAGRRYAVADLPPDARQLFEGIRRADLLLAQKGETCQQLRWGLDAFIRELGQKLRTVEPLPELLAPPDPRSPSGDGVA